MEKENAEMKLYKLFARILYDVGRGYAREEAVDFIKYILELNMESRKKIEIVKTSLQLAIIWKELGNRYSELMRGLINNVFSIYKNIEIEKIKNFIEKLAMHKEISSTRLRGVYLEAIS